MRHIIDPRQNRLFDQFDGVLSDMARQRLVASWPGVFRAIALQELPVAELAQNFSGVTGRPTKELFSMAGLVFLADFFGWTAEEAAYYYMLHIDVQFALNVESQAECCQRTVERYRELFIDDELAAKTFDRVTATLVEALELNVTQQRLDSTHVHSHMATFGRTKLMAVTLKRCLTQIKRHAPIEFATLDKDLRTRYAPSEAKLFGDAKTADERSRSRRQVAEDMRTVVELFADHAAIKNRPSYQALVAVFHEQCVIVENKIELIDKTGGDVIQNPSDLDATYDGHKGAGYQLQISETCSDENEVQLILGVNPETACQSDANAVQPMLEQLQAAGFLPDELTADTIYNGDANYVLAESMGVELIGPIPGAPPQTDPNALTLDDFAHHEETGDVTACPAGHTPLAVIRDETTQTTRVVMSPVHCESCPLLAACPIEHKKVAQTAEPTTSTTDQTTASTTDQATTSPTDQAARKADQKANPKPQKVDQYETTFSDQARRTAARRREQETTVFNERYAKRAGIESTNSGLKNRFGLGRLKVRGRGAVFRQLLMKVAGWNVLRAAASLKLRAKVSEMLVKLLGAGWSASSRQFAASIARRLTSVRVVRERLETLAA